MARQRINGQSTTSTATAVENEDNSVQSKDSEARSSPKTLLVYSQLPEWLKDNSYIVTAYRPASHSITSSLRSAFTLHNETMNIQTHLFGAVAFSIISQSPFPPNLPAPPFPLLSLPLNMPPLIPFYLGAVTCLGLSAFYHATSNVSPKVARLGNQADYLGILALITGSFISSIYYGFHCHTHLRSIYWGMIVSIGVACGIVTVNPRFRTPEWRTFRASMFVAMGLSALIPVLHGCRLYGIEGMEDRIGLRWLVAQGITYIAGAGLYALRVPERWKPGTFDIFGASHQIFHIFVLIAAGMHLVGLLKAAEHMVKEGGLCEDVV